MVKTGVAPAEVGKTEFFDRARARLRFDIPPGLTDARLVPLTGDQGNDFMLQAIAKEKPIRPAAVLIPVVARDEPTVLLTQRSAHLNEHAGQIAFPGGKIDASDASPVDAALREAWEEVGLAREYVEPIGYLDLYGTGFGFRILPTVARVKPGFDLRINAGEVDDAFEVPLSFLMNPLNHKMGQKEFRGMQRSFYEMPYAERYIWGATAGILRVLYERDLSEMIRPALTEIGIFLIPFAVYAIFLIATRSGFLVATAWPLYVIVRLAFVALLLMIFSFILLAHFSGAPPKSTYVPAHMENGKLIPGVEK